MSDAVGQWPIAGPIADGATRWAQSADPSDFFIDSVNPAVVRLKQRLDLG